ncbi:hypothetical protein N7475_010548 [Penicillium sp. IBT 31633x]|nr:hypothetical protein N7475_010548 [Penicillium sp. IBT 31633x]
MAGPRYAIYSGNVPMDITTVSFCLKNRPLRESKRITCTTSRATLRKYLEDIQYGNRGFV